MTRFVAIFLTLCCMLLGIVGVVALPSRAQAACAGDWDISGEWQLEQTNGYSVRLRLQQGGNSITGDAALGPTKGYGGGFSKPISDGRINGNTFEFAAPHIGGVYTGLIDDAGGMVGTTHEIGNTAAKATWNTGHVATCRVVTTATPPSQAEPPPPPAAPDKPVKILGKIKSTVTDLGNEIEYTYPFVTTSSGTIALDWCRVWANDCGKGAADVFCRQAGHQAAARFARFDGLRKTWVIDDKKECNGPCASFKSIVCTKVAGTAGGGGAEYATAKTPATIYVEPGGAAFKDANGNDIGIPVGSKFLVLEKRTNPIWYKLQTKPVGWVWGEDVTLGP